MKIKDYILEITVFICGAVVMVFELVGSRVLGPYFGTSLFVWTSLIGIILGSLSLGYYVGGKVADKKADQNGLSLVVLFAAISIFLVILIKDNALVFLKGNISDIRFSSVAASLILFSPASILLGMVSPYAAKLKLNSLGNSGTTIGNLYAISTAGSIFGTFLSGFYLIPHFGTNKLLVILLSVLLLVHLLLLVKKDLKGKALILLVIIISWPVTGWFNTLVAKKGVIDVDTGYNRIWIYDIKDPETDKTAKIMGINNEAHSLMFLDSDELANEYTKYYHLVKHFNPNFKTTLMFGGAGYSYPKDFLLKYPNASIDVVEIDPGITELAKKYFKLKENPNLAIYHQDGRVYLNETKKKYDAIFGDAFSSQYSLPYQLTTREAVQKKYKILNDDGVVILNIISAVDGEKGEFLRAEYVTYKSIFPQVYLFLVNVQNNGKPVQNIILVALKSEKKPDFNSTDQTMNAYLRHLWQNELPADLPVLTDDYAPVDYYIGKMI
jgi:spermidine synthase